ncbi:hypothetical protein XCR_3151 [Xanthomonas campestris pv. raphani 756C]|nr:hypothetical protein XCR_3151 [Xanthomonas campestris pv. raphani 756C]
MVDTAAAEAAHCDDRPAWRTAGRLAVLTARLQALRAITPHRSAHGVGDAQC